MPVYLCVYKLDCIKLHVSEVYEVLWAKFGCVYRCVLAVLSVDQGAANELAPVGPQQLTQYGW